MSTFLNVLERLLEEFVKELLLNDFTVVSASYEVRNGRKIRKRRAHLHKRPYSFAFIDCSKVRRFDIRVAGNGPEYV